MSVKISGGPLVERRLMQPDRVIEAGKKVAHYPGQLPDLRHGRYEVMPQQAEPRATAVRRSMRPTTYKQNAPPRGAGRCRHEGQCRDQLVPRMVFPRMAANVDPA
jgi:hypothetical protein